jgi:hypothetical protein
MDIFANSIALITAVIGLLGSVYAVLVNQTTRNILPPDNALVTSKVLRIPLDKKVWEKRRKAHTFLHKVTDVVVVSLCVIIVVLVIRGVIGGSTIQALVKDNATHFHPILVMVAGAIILLTYSFIGLNILLRKRKFGQTPEEGRFFIFKDAVISVEATYSEIINRSYDALKALHIHSIELDLKTNTLEGQKIFPLYLTVGIVKIEIQPTNQMHIHPNQKCEYAIKVQLIIPHQYIPGHPNSIELTSEITNAFIEQFVGQTKR